MQRRNVWVSVSALFDGLSVEEFDGGRMIDGALQV
jgi:hypothetical protein